MIWMCLPHNWPFVMGIHMDSPHKWLAMWRSDAFFVIILNKLLHQQSSCQWFSTPWCPCYITIILRDLSRQVIDTITPRSSLKYTMMFVTKQEESSDQKCMSWQQSSVLVYPVGSAHRLRENGWHFADSIFKFTNLSLVEIMGCRLFNDKPLFEPWWNILLMHVCFTQPQWFNTVRPEQNGSILQHHFCMNILVRNH